MKGLFQYELHGIAILCLFSLRVMSFNSVEAQEVNISTAEQLLALKEGELSLFTAAVEANSRDCGALIGCSNSNCSRLACYTFGTPGDTNYKCLDVANNSFCNALGSAPCTQRNFDFTKGFVRRVDPIDNHIARTVCTQRSLDSHFKNSTMADPYHFFRVFFGAVDGMFRIYPGSDETCENIYDPRVRPWYKQSTDIPKVVTVLIDSGLSMRDTISGTNDETYISKAIATALRFLDTLHEDQDYVTFTCFDGDGVKQLNTTKIYNRTLLYQSIYDSFTGVVANGSKSDPNATHTNNAINVTINQLDQLTTSNSIPANYLKVVIALIGGQQYRDISDLDVSLIPYMNLFIYSFRTQREPQCNQFLRASLEEIPDDRLNNPLYALQSYYSFLAKLHRSFMKNQTDYGPQYEDFSGIDSNTLTLSKAAFGPSGELLGVLGLDFFEHLVEEQFHPSIQFQSIVEEAGKHDPGRIFDTSIDLVTNVCFNHTEACPGLDTTYVQGFLCDQSTSTDKNIGCCGTCKINTPPSIAPAPSIIPKKPEAWIKIVAGVFGGLGGLDLLNVVAVLAVIAWRASRDRKKKRKDVPLEDRGFPGTEEITARPDEAIAQPDEAIAHPETAKGVGRPGDGQNET